MVRCGGLVGIWTLFEELPQCHCTLFFVLLFPTQHSPRLFLLSQRELAQAQHGDIFGQIFLDSASPRDLVRTIVVGLVDLIAVVEARGVCLELVVSLGCVSRAFGAHDKAQGRFLEELARRLVCLKDGNHGVGHGESVVLEVAEHFNSSVFLQQPEDLATLSQRLYTRVQAQVHRAILDGPDEG